MKIKISREWYEYKNNNCYHSNKETTFEIESLEKIENEIEDIINNLEYNYYKSSDGELILAPLDSVLLHKSKTNITLNYTFLLCNGKVLNQSFEIIDEEYLEKVKKMRRIDVIMSDKNGLDILAEIMCNDCCAFCDLDIHCDDCTDEDYKEVAKKYLNEEIDVPMKDIKLEISDEGIKKVFKNVKEVKRNNQQCDDKVNHPSHYNQGIEAIDIIESWNLDFCLGNVIKYVLRAKYKGNTIEDLEKARWYLNREIDTLKNI